MLIEPTESETLEEIDRLVGLVCRFLTFLINLCQVL